MHGSLAAPPWVTASGAGTVAARMPRVVRPADVAANRALWDEINSQFAGADGLARWHATEITWGLTATPESQVRVLGDLAGLDVVELGCGTAYLAGWLARRGARVIGLDVSGAQLGTARIAQSEHGIAFPLIQADAQAVPLTSGCADLVVSEHGAPAWCAPDLWIGQAARILRPGGRLVFLTNSPLSAMCVPEAGGVASNQLLRGPAELREVRWPGGGVEHHPSHGDWIGVLRTHGFDVDALIELRASREPSAAATFYSIADPEWAQRWPVEDLWVARLR